MGMGRRRSSAVAAVTTAALVAWTLFFSLHLLLLPAPASSQAQAVLLRYMIRARPLIREVVKDFLKDRAAEGVTDIFRRNNDKAGGDVPDPNKTQLGSAAASTAALVVFDLSVGTRTVSGVMDISSQLIWTADCQQATESGSFSWLPCSSATCQRVLNQSCAAGSDRCDYVATYSADATVYTSGYLATDTFIFGATSVPSMVLGCSGAVSTVDLSASCASGVIGFGRGPLSLVSQLNLTKFSYFLAPDDSDGSESVIRLGGDAVPQTRRGRSTPLLRSNKYTDLYYVRLTGVQVDGKALSGIPAGTFELRADGSGGVFLSTTLPVTYMEEAAYRVVRRALVSRIQSQGVSPFPGDVDRLCYLTPSFVDVKVPRLTLVFDGAKAAMELKPENYFFRDIAGGAQTCLTILPSRGGSVLGSLVQTSRNMIFDVGAGWLTFETAPEEDVSSSDEEDASSRGKGTATSWLSPKVSHTVMAIGAFAVIALAMVCYVLLKFCAGGGAGAK